jgi:hypothetical protein
MAVSSVFSDHKFLPWLFRRVPYGYFEILGNRQKYIEWLKNTVDVETVDQLQKKHFIENQGAGLLHLYGDSPQGVLDSLRHSETSPTISSNRDHHPRNYWVRRKCSSDSFVVPSSFDL